MWWRPTYKTARGTPFPIFGVQARECPRSTLDHLDPLSKELTSLYIRAKNLKEAGVDTFPDGEVSILLADAFLVLSDEEKKYDAALNEWNHHDDENLRRR